jgi:hypothetical protein
MPRQNAFAISSRTPRRDSFNDDDRLIVDLLVALVVVTCITTYFTLTLARQWQCEQQAVLQHWDAERTAICYDQSGSLFCP